jgi:hypothetical protein
MYYYDLSAAGVIRPFMIFVTEEIFVGQLFDAYIFRMKIKMRKLFQFYSLILRYL